MTLCRPYRNVPGYLLALTLMAICLVSNTVSGSEVVVNEGGPPSREKLQRFTRSSGISFSIKEVNSVKTIYNALRGSIKDAANMRRMEWNVELREEAQSYVSFCDYTRVPTEYQGSPISVRGYVSNAGTSSRAFSEWQGAFRSLFRLKPNCNDKSGRGCSDFKKVIQAESENLGCAKKYCSSMSNHPTHRKGHFIVCLHAPAASASRKPYVRGKQCSRCSAGFKYCVRGLCSRKESEKQIGTGSTRYPNKSVVVAMVTAVTVWCSL